MADQQPQQPQQPQQEPQATHFVVNYEPGVYAIFPALVVDEVRFWLQRRWIDCAHCLQDMEADAEENANGPGCPGIPGQPPCMNGRQGKTAMGRWSCNACAHYLGLLMRNEITAELALLGQEGKLLRLLAQVHAPADADPMECVVKARFANALNGQMCTQDKIANHADPVVFNTRVWAMSLMVGILPHQPDAFSCMKINVEEHEGHVVHVQVLGAQMGVNGWGVNVQQEDEEEAAEQP